MQSLHHSLTQQSQENLRSYTHSQQQLKQDSLNNFLPRSKEKDVFASRDNYRSSSGIKENLFEANVALLTGKNETVYGLWNTIAGGNSTLSTPGSSIGNYNPNETPDRVFDQNSTTKYNSYGACNVTFGNAPQCGLNTGLYLTLQQGALLLTGIRFRTANSLPERDPIKITVEGSNRPSSALLLSSSWTLIYNGSCGLDSDPGRYSLGVTEIISNNVVPYDSYRLLITSKRNLSSAVQYSEVELLGH
ncbi:unnamed protein product [Rotaria sordida]|uniref:Uncharacterized protein n=1 Tax=Rotaria sordida TaxID=392033 RepID=A0A818T1N8_9BILA|nr:unnamed protein product [Rotaria sordida]CAF3678694.1 unnamed protein product [Rotaria sordida]